MQHREWNARATPLLSGAALILAGSAIALWLPGGLVGAFALFLLLRICWLEENIRSDLMRASHLPEGYRTTQALQRRWQMALFGEASEPITCPQRLASILRVQSHALYALLLGGCAAFVATAAALPVLGGILGAAILVLACQRVDRLVAAETILGQGGTLPEEMLEARGPIARFVLNQ
ncbi:MAG: hypothetical protein AAGG09_08530 [Pseudomonadota bacterium]